MSAPANGITTTLTPRRQLAAVIFYDCLCPAILRTDTDPRRTYGPESAGTAELPAWTNPALNLTARFSTKGPRRFHCRYCRRLTGSERFTASHLTTSGENGKPADKQSMRHQYKWSPYTLLNIKRLIWLQVLVIYVPSPPWVAV